MSFDASVIISFYNKIEILKLVLAGFERQSRKNFEIIIADDGSANPVVDELQQIMKVSPLRIKHVWHPDNGWQKNIILNRAIVAASAEYIIFTDGDCIPHRHFIKEHLLARETNHVLTGRRVLLSRRISEFLTVTRVKHGYLEKLLFPWMLIERMSGEGQYVENAVYVSWRCIRKRLNKKDRGLLGSNFSLHKADLLAINGFDERYLSPYVGEDTDLEFRLRLNACKFKHLKHLAIQYHYYHHRLEFNDSNYSILNDNKQRKTGHSPFGIIKS
ncbi:MAG: glycosyltransferase [Bacteroidales bacterium]|nr:glycosyltransferase [Bacteroidales bacterium]